MTNYKPTESMAPLVDIPCVYLLKRSSWPEFKRALNECGLTWNLPEWMTTIVHQGAEWKQVVASGTNLQDYFPQVEKRTAGDGSYFKTSLLGQKISGNTEIAKKPREPASLNALLLFIYSGIRRRAETPSAPTHVVLDRPFSPRQSPICWPVPLPSRCMTFLISSSA